MRKPLPLAFYGHPILRQKAQPVEEIDEALKVFADDLIFSMLHYDGLGLAAPQVHKPLRLFAMRTYRIDDDENLIWSDPEIIINPILADPSDECLDEEEGCLSIPGMKGVVERPYSIALEAYDLEGRPIKRRLEGLSARIVMHETDHLNGRFFHERMRKKERQAFEKKLKAKQHLFGK